MSKPQLPATLSGTVSRFAGKGRQFGYPTANITLVTSLPDGIYLGLADLAHYSQHPALVFIGTPTTVGDSGRRVEAHLLDIEDIDFYGDALSLQLTEYLRPSQTFATVPELLQVMKTDEAAARQWFKEHSHL